MNSTKKNIGVLGRKNFIEQITTTIIICLIASYFICIKLKTNIYFHTDGIAPIHQILLLVNNDFIGLTDLRLARIPSLIPDLSILYLIIKALNTQDLFVIQANYAFIITLLFIIGSTTVVYILFKNKLNLINCSLITILPNTLLINYSSPFREAMGHFLTPVHQGGNILITIFFIPIFMLIKNKYTLNNISIRILYLIITLLGAISIVSNKLFFFTVIAPFLVIILIKHISNIENILKYKSFIYSQLLLISLGIIIIIFGSSGLGITFGTKYTLSWLISKSIQTIGILMIGKSLIRILKTSATNLKSSNVINTKSVAKDLLRSTRKLFSKSKQNSQIKYITLILVPIFLLINSISFYLNTQCMSSIRIDLFSTLNGMKSILLNYKILIPILILYCYLFISTVYRLYSIRSKNKISKIPMNNFQTNIDYIIKDPYNFISNINFTYLFISLSGLSPLVYLWLAEGVYSRYLLITLLLFPISISITLPKIILSFKQFNNISINRICQRFIVFLLTISVLLTFNIDLNAMKKIAINSLHINNANPAKDEGSLLSNISLSKAFKRSALSVYASGFALDNEQIHSLGLKYGLSDFWNTAVAEIGINQLQISPIGYNGEPDTWAHSKYNFLDISSNKIKNFNFIYTRKEDFARSIIKEYGNPTEIYQINRNLGKPIKVGLDSIDDDHSFILYYPKNSDGWKNIQVKIADSISRERNRC